MTITDSRSTRLARTNLGRIRRPATLLALLVALVAGCGGGDDINPHFLVNAPHRGEAIVKVRSNGDADRVCDAAKLAEYHQLDGIRLLIVKPPSADQGRNSDGTHCELPAH